MGINILLNDVKLKSKEKEKTRKFVVISKLAGTSKGSKSKLNLFQGNFSAIKIKQRGESLSF
jgi:hypothetical protein